MFSCKEKLKGNLVLPITYHIIISYRIVLLPYTTTSLDPRIAVLDAHSTPRPLTSHQIGTSLRGAQSA